MSRFPLQDIYDALPKVNCKGLCYGECTALVMTELEAKRMTEAGGEPPALTETGCNYLGADHRCKIYDARPLLCRLFGVSQGLTCPFGCEPEKILSDDTTKLIRGLTTTIGGDEVCNFSMGELRQLIDDVNRGEIIP